MQREGVGLREQGGASSSGRLWSLATSNHAFAFGGLEFLGSHYAFGYGHSRYALSDGKRNHNTDNNNNNESKISMLSVPKEIGALLSTNRITF